MSTGDQFVALAPKRIMGVQDFRERMRDYFRTLSTDIMGVAFGLDGIFGGVAVTISAPHGADRFQLDNDPTTTDGAGKFLATNVDLAYRDIGVAFENTNLIVYSIGLKSVDRPRVVQINPRTTSPEYVAEEETIGESDDPVSVVDNGDGTMTFNVDSVADPFGTTVRTHAGRRCLVFKKIPGATATTEALATEVVLVTWTGSANEITTLTTGGGGAGTFGQIVGSASVLPADYTVIMLGPTVTRFTETDLDLEAGYVFIGEITGNAGTPVAFDISGQNDLQSGLAVDISDITRGPVNGRLKLSTTAHPLDSEENQIDARNGVGTVVFSVDEDGDVEMNDLVVNGLADINELVDLTVLGDCLLGDAEADNHTLRGRLQQKDDLNATIAELTRDFGHLGVGGAADVTAFLKVFGGAILDGQAAIGQDLNDGILVDQLTANIDLGKLGATAGTGLHLLGKWEMDGAVTNARLYAVVGTTPVLLITTNAFWNDPPGEWEADVPGGASPAMMLLLTQGELAMFKKADTTLAWAFTGAWDGPNNNDFDFIGTDGAGSTFRSGMAFSRDVQAGESLLGSMVNAAIARFSAKGPDADYSSGGVGPSYTRMLEFLNGAGGLRPNVAFFFKQNLSAASTPTDGLWIVLNARWDGSSEDWSQIDGTEPSMAIHFQTYNDAALGETAFARFMRQTPQGAGTWADTLWIEGPALFLADDFAGAKSYVEAHDFAGFNFEAIGATGDAFQPNPDIGTTGLGNKLRSKNIVKAWANIFINAGAGSIVEGFGVTATVTNLAPDIGINLAAGNLASALTKTCPIVTHRSGVAPGTGRGIILRANTPVSAAQIRISAWEDDGTVVDLTAAGTTLQLSMMLCHQQ